MKKLIFILSVIVFASCSSDDDNTNSGNSQVVGKWVFSAIRVQVEADQVVKNAVSTDKQNDENRAKGKYLVFTNDGKYTNTYEGYSNIDYSVKNGRIVHLNEQWPFSVSGNTFTYTFDDTEEYKEMYPNNNVSKVVFYWDYVKSDL